MAGEIIGKEKQIIEANAVNSPVKDIQWTAQEAQTETVPIVDPGVGQGTILRSFFFKAAPMPKGEKRPSKADILSHYKRLIDDFLWKDSLVAIGDKPAQVYTRKELKKGAMKTKMIEEGADFVIMILAIAKHGAVIADNFNKV